MNIGQAVAKRVNALLKIYGKSQYRIAKDIAASPNTISGIVLAKNKTASITTIFLLCRALGITVDEFFDDPVFKSAELEID